MPVEIRMPELGGDVEEADLVSWLVRPGDHVQAGDLIAEIETDKSTVEFESPVSGTLVELTVAEGTSDVAVGTVLAIIEADANAATDADAPQTPPPAPEPAAAPPPEPQPAPASQPATAPAAERAPRPPSEPAAAPRPAEPAAPEVPATALARRIARREGVDLAGLRGSGAGGRILKADVEAASAEAPPARSAGPAAAPPSRDEIAAQVDAPYEAVPHSRMRRTIAARLSEAKRTVPHFYLRIECELDTLLELRRRFNDPPEEAGLSVNDFIVRAAALALVEVPDANVSYDEDALLRWQRVDVAVAVATEGGLVTPVVRSADRKELRVLSGELRDLATRARDGRLRPNEYRGGTFTVSNLGMFGVEAVYPILNPPQACILGVGAGGERVVVRDGRPAVATVATLTLAADHRALDGATGARLLAALKRRLEDPMEMLL